jgi:photosystem II stability/assembly factor-like uncharacterized protein
VTAVNPIDPTVGLNAEGVAASDGAVFMILQAFAGAQTVKHVFQVNPLTGIATNLTGTAPVPGAEGRLTTSGRQAAWPFYESVNGPAFLHFYDGQTLRVVDTDIVGNPHLARGRLVYSKAVNGVEQIFLYDSTTANPAPVQLTFNTTGRNYFPRTDGSHIAWLRTETGSTDVDIVLNGGMRLSNADTRVTASNEMREHPLQLNNGQFLWRDFNGRLIYAVDGRASEIALAPAVSFGGNNCCVPWLADGRVAFMGQSNDGGEDNEVFLFSGILPAAGPPLPPFITATPVGTNGARVEWDKIVGASSYNIYIGYDSWVGPETYQTMPGAISVANPNTPFEIVSGLTNRIYFFVVTAVTGGVEGPVSAPAAVTFWKRSGNVTTPFYAVAAGRTNGAIAYAAGGSNVYKTTDGGATWTVLPAMAGKDVRALAVDGPRVYAATRDVFGGAPAQIWRSVDAGATWSAVVEDGGQIGEQIKALAIDPSAPLTVYAGNFRLPQFNDELESFLIKTTDGGDRWNHLREPLTPTGAELRAYSIIINPSSSSDILVGGSGTPNMARSADAGLTWRNISPGRGAVYSVAVDPSWPDSVFAGVTDYSRDFGGVFKTGDGGTTWFLRNSGLPRVAMRVNSILVDPVVPGMVHLGTDYGYYMSIDWGETWIPGNGGLAGFNAQNIYSLAMTETRNLIAATGEGLFVLDLSMMNLELPTVAVAREGNDVVITWSATASGFVLESTTDLGSGSWQAVNEAVVVNGGRAAVRITQLKDVAFIRLRKQ